MKIEKIIDTIAEESNLPSNMYLVTFPNDTIKIEIKNKGEGWMKTSEEFQIVKSFKNRLEEQFGLKHVFGVINEKNNTIITIEL